MELVLNLQWQLLAPEPGSKPSVGSGLFLPTSPTLSCMRMRADRDIKKDSPVLPGVPVPPGSCELPLPFSGEGTQTEAVH